MPIFNSLDRLNAMHDLFTSQGNGKLDAGEVDALAGFYKGLPPASRSKIEKRLIDILDNSKMAAPQRAHFRELLRNAGLSTDKQLEVLLESSNTREIELKDVPATARAKIKSEVKAWSKAKEAELKASDGYDAEMDHVAGATYEAVQDERGKTVGYRVHVEVYQADHDVGSQLTFDLKGKLVDEIYEGE